jgi:hypothetical protein
MYHTVPSVLCICIYAVVALVLMEISSWVYYKVYGEVTVEKLTSILYYR